jgi:hypothetical protein
MPLEDRCAGEAKEISVRTRTGLVWLTKGTSGPLSKLR